MVSSNSTSASFMGRRWKGANDGTSSTLQVPVHSAGSTDSYYGHGVTDLLEPALDSPPSPEGLRALGRRIKRGSIADQQNNEQATSSGSSSLRSDTPETLWERGLDNISLSRNPSQRSLVMPFKDRPDSVQLFGKAVFARRPRLRREQSEQGYSSNSFLTLTETPTETSTLDPSKEQGFIQSMFTRRARGTSEASQKRFQISGPYGFQHVAHSSKENVAELDRFDRNDSLPNLPGTRLRTKTGPSITPVGINSVDKPLPSPPTQQDNESISPRGSIQMSPPRHPKYLPDDVPPTPHVLPPRTSSRASVRHDRTDSFSTNTINTTTNSNLQVQSFKVSSTDGALPPTSQSTTPSNEEPAWPLASSMTSLPEVPEEEECYLGNITSHPSHRRTPTALRGSVSVPHLRRVSLRKGSRRSPSNASETLGAVDLATTRRPLYEFNDVKASECTYIRDSWEDDIDYCYEHAAEADCDFAWERPSCDFEREDDFPESPILSNMKIDAHPSHLGVLPPRHLSVDLPGLSPTSNGSASTQLEAMTPINSTMPRASNFSLPKIDTSILLKRGFDRNHSGASSVQEVQEFSLSPSLLIPDEYHEKILQIERADLSRHASSTDLNNLQHDDQYLNAYSRSSASTTISSLSEQSIPSSRHGSSGFARWTGSTTSIPMMQDEKENAISPTSQTTARLSVETPASSLQQESDREGRGFFSKMKVRQDSATLAEAKAAKELLKAQKRTRTASKTHNPVLPQFSLSPQVMQHI